MFRSTHWMFAYPMLSVFSDMKMFLSPVAGQSVTLLPSHARLTISAQVERQQSDAKRQLR